jgi:tetratricopeptide (TPR) repeat protein
MPRTDIAVNTPCFQREPGLPNRAKLAATLVAALLFYTAVAHAQEPAAKPNRMSWGELALLPEYCRDAQGIIYGDASSNTSPRAGKWVALMGQDFWHMHHYCRALLSMNRAKVSGVTQAQRTALWLNAESDYRYVLNNCRPTMPLMPEVLVRLGELHLEMGKMDEAYTDFAQARDLKPDYWPAYSRWVDVLTKLNKRGEARALAEAGLAQAPGSEVLRQQVRTLGGDPDRIVSAASAAQGAASRPAP